MAAERVQGTSEAVDLHAPRPTFWTASRRRFYGAAIGGAAMLAFYGSISAWRDSHAVLINATQSLPNWAFLLEKKLPPRRGDLVFFDPPLSPLLIAHFGVHPELFAKRVYGVGGDRVTRTRRRFFVNGRLVATAKPVSTRGEPLAVGPTGIIPLGCYFVGTPAQGRFRQPLCSDRLDLPRPCRRHRDGDPVSASWTAHGVSIWDAFDLEVTREEALAEIGRHDVEGGAVAFLEEVGDRDSYEGREVLEWLGY